MELSIRTKEVSVLLKLVDRSRFNVQILVHGHGNLMLLRKIQS